MSSDFATINTANRNSTCPNGDTIGNASEMAIRIFTPNSLIITLDVKASDTMEMFKANIQGHGMHLDNVQMYICQLIADQCIVAELSSSSQLTDNTAVDLVIRAEVEKDCFWGIKGGTFGRMSISLAFPL